MALQNHLSLRWVSAWRLGARRSYACALGLVMCRNASELSVDALGWTVALGTRLAGGCTTCIVVIPACRTPPVALICSTRYVHVQRWASCILSESYVHACRWPSSSGR